MNHAAAIGVLLFALLIAACSQGASTDKATSTASASTPTHTAVIAESAGDVVIAPPVSPYTERQVANPGTLSGIVTLKGTMQPVAPTVTGADGRVCGALIADNSLQQTRNGLGMVVVWLDGIRSGKPLGQEKRIELESDHCRLTPRVQAATTGSAVNIIGHDDFRQHLRLSAAGDASPRATVLMGGGEQVIPTELPFKTPGMVSVRDPERSWTRAYLAVFDHPYFVVSAPTGAFTIEGIPPGSYTLRVWHERAGTTQQQVTIAAGGTANVSVELSAR